MENASKTQPRRSRRVIVIGAGMGGLSSAIALAGAGHEVMVLEKEAAPGGKMRHVAVGDARIDGGPTVFTMKWVFDRLLAPLGIALESRVSLTPAGTLARHAWQDGSRLDLFADIDRSAAAIEAFSDARNAEGYSRFCADSAAIHDTLRDTYMAAQRPGMIELTRRIGPLSIGKMLALRPFQTLWGALGGYFPDARLRQLFGRYATYCGSSPFSSPATLMLVAHVEQAGVWIVTGGMHTLARAFATIAAEQGAVFRYGTKVARIETDGEGITGVILADGERIEAGSVIFNGDISALAGGLLGDAGPSAGVRAVRPRDRSLSAVTWCAEVDASALPLAHHTVMFGDDYRGEFEMIFKDGQTPRRPTVYVCAQDRSSDGDLSALAARRGRERLLVLTNAPANGDTTDYEPERTAACLSETMAQMARCGFPLDFSSATRMATAPDGFNRLFPGSGGALYGMASHGWMASFSRSGSRTAIPGLYLAGGSVHPGAGVPMACLSGQLAAASLEADHALTRRSRPMVTSGGMSMA